MTSYLTCNCSALNQKCYDAVPVCRDGILANSIIVWADSNPTRAIYKYYPGKTYYFTGNWNWVSDFLLK